MFLSRSTENSGFEGFHRNSFDYPFFKKKDPKKRIQEVYILVYLTGIISPYGLHDKKYRFGECRIVPVKTHRSAVFVVRISYFRLPRCISHHGNRDVTRPALSLIEGPRRTSNGPPPCPGVYGDFPLSSHTHTVFFFRCPCLY